jgi:hypothetical protein
VVADHLEDVGKRRQCEHEHHHPLMPGATTKLSDEWRR